MRDDPRTFAPGQLACNTSVLLISLPDQDLRRRDLQSRGVPAAWVDNFLGATDLRTAACEDLSRFADIATLQAKLRRPVRPAEIGCALSHRAACQWLSKSGNPLALILEDDIIPKTEDWIAQVAATANALTPHANRGAAFICHLGAPENQTATALKRKVTWRNGAAPACTPDLYLQTDPKHGLWRAHAYLISRAAAERSVGQETLIKTLADDWIERRLYGWIDEIFFTRMPIIGQDEERPSTIGERGGLAGAASSISHSVEQIDDERHQQKSNLLLRASSSLYGKLTDSTRRVHALFPYGLSVDR